jgi:hypothetical protein
MCYYALSINLSVYNIIWRVYSRIFTGKITTLQQMHLEWSRVDSKYLKGKAEVLPIQGAFNGSVWGRDRAMSTNVVYKGTY